MSVKQDVDARAQIAHANVLVAQIRVRNFALIEGITYPPDRISISPRNPNPDARRFSLVTRYIRWSGNLDKVEAQFRSGGENGLVQSGLTGKNPRSGGKLRVAFLKVPFSNLNFEISQMIAGGEKRLLSSIFQQISGARTDHASSRTRRTGQPRQCYVANGRVSRRYRLQMVMSGKFPRDIIIGRFSVLRVVLRGEQIDSVVAVGLIEANHVGSSRKVAFLELNGTPRPVNFDLLAQELSDHLCHPGRVSLIFRNQERPGRLGQSFLPGIPCLSVEIAHHFFGTAGGFVQRGEGAGLLVIEIVASRPGGPA